MILPYDCDPAIDCVPPRVPHPAPRYLPMLFHPLQKRHFEEALAALLVDRDRAEAPIPVPAPSNYEAVKAVQLHPDRAAADVVTLELAAARSPLDVLGLLLLLALDWEAECDHGVPRVRLSVTQNMCESVHTLACALQPCTEQERVDLHSILHLARLLCINGRWSRAAGRAGPPADLPGMGDL